MTKISPIRAIAGKRTIVPQRLQEAVHHQRPLDRLGRRDRDAPRDRHADARRAFLPGDGALCHAGGDADAARRSAVNLDQWLADEVQIVFAEQEGAAFVSGDGTNKPKGFLSLHHRSPMAPGPGAISATSRPAPPAPSRRDQSVRRADRSHLCAEVRLIAPTRIWVMNRKTQASIRKFKDADGNYHLAAAGALAASLRLRCMSYPVAEAEDMPDIAANSLLDRVRRFRARLSGGRSRRHHVLRDPYSRQALRAVLHDQARRRRRAGLRGHQADEVRGVVAERTSRPPLPSGERAGVRGARMSENPSPAPMQSVGTTSPQWGEVEKSLAGPPLSLPEGVADARVPGRAEPIAGSDSSC